MPQSLDELYDFPNTGGFLQAKDFLPNVPKVLTLKKKWKEEQTVSEATREEGKYASPDGQIRFYEVDEYAPNMTASTKKMSFSKPTSIYIAMHQAGILINDTFSLTWNGEAGKGSRFEAVKLPDLATVENVLAKAAQLIKEAPARPTPEALDNMFGKQ